MPKTSLIVESSRVLSVALIPTAVELATPGVLKFTGGRVVALNESDASVLSYLRRYKDQAVLVVLNMSGQKHKAAFDLTSQGFTGTKVSTMLTTVKTSPKEVSVLSITLEPFGVYIGKIVK